MLNCYPLIFKDLNQSHITSFISMT